MHLPTSDHWFFGVHVSFQGNIPPIKWASIASCNGRQNGSCANTVDAHPDPWQSHCEGTVMSENRHSGCYCIRMYENFLLLGRKDIKAFIWHSPMFRKQAVGCRDHLIDALQDAEPKAASRKPSKWQRLCCAKTVPITKSANLNPETSIWIQY